ncbi:MAG: TatD family hydrolase [Planctomycetota bacterium]
MLRRMIDTHCHLTFPDFRGRLAEELDEAAAHGVLGCITISTTSSDCVKALRLAQSDARVWSTSGIHPLHAHEGPHDWDTVVRCASDPRCVAWGELGLDNHYDTPDAATQRRVLDEQLAVIESQTENGRTGLGKPVVIHCREAFDDLLPVLDESSIDGDRFVFHCFTGTPDDARSVLDFGAMISLTGVATYRNASAVRAAAKLIPADRLMFETDAPYLAPEPRRGERPCRPWMTMLTARAVAEARGEPWGTFHAQIDANVRRFFGIDWPAASGASA